MVPQGEPTVRSAMREFATKEQVSVISQVEGVAVLGIDHLGLVSEDPETWMSLESRTFRVIYIATKAFDNWYLYAPLLEGVEGITNLQDRKSELERLLDLAPKGRQVYADSIRTLCLEIEQRLKEEDGLRREGKS